MLRFVSGLRLIDCCESLVLTFNKTKKYVCSCRSLRNYILNTNTIYCINSNANYVKRMRKDDDDDENDEEEEGAEDEVREVPEGG